MEVVKACNSLEVSLKSESSLSSFPNFLNHKLNLAYFCMAQVLPFNRGGFLHPVGPDACISGSFERHITVKCFSLQRQGDDAECHPLKAAHCIQNVNDDSQLDII